jgi:hypothetical protein
MYSSNWLLVKWFLVILSLNFGSTNIHGTLRIRFGGTLRIRFGAFEIICLLFLTSFIAKAARGPAFLDTVELIEPPCYVGERPACEISWSPQVNAVFLGTIVDVTKDPNTANSDKTLKLIVTATVDEPFIGIKDKTAIIKTGGNSNGPYPFSKGLRYVIYAKRMNDGTYTVSSCGGTKWENIESDLKYLRSLPSAAATSCVYGSAFRYIEPHSENSMASRCMSPLKDKVISVKGKSPTFTAVVDRDGQYNVGGLPAGDYFVDI